MDWSPPGSSVHGIFQAIILEGVAISFSRGSSWPREGTHISCIDRQILYHWATREAQFYTCQFHFPNSFYLPSPLVSIHLFPNLSLSPAVLPRNHKFVLCLHDHFCIVNQFICTIFFSDSAPHISNIIWICLSLSDLFHSVWQFLDPSLLLQMVLLHSSFMAE